MSVRDWGQGMGWRQGEEHEELQVGYVADVETVEYMLMQG